MCETDKSPTWLCPATVEAYNDLLGNPGGTEADIIELAGGAGTECGHFAEEIFGDELSSGIFETDIQDAHAPLSKITAAALDDTGYVVNAAAVDDYTLPSRRSGEASVGAARAGRRYVMKSRAVESVIIRIDGDGNEVGSMPGVMMNLYGGYED